MLQFDHTQNEKVCSIHGLEVVAMNIDPCFNQCDRYFCIKCLMTERRRCQLVSINDAETHFLELKQAFKQRKECQFNHNIETLKDLASKVMLLKDSFNQLLEKLHVNILEWILVIKQQINQTDERVLHLDVHKYLQQKESLQEESQLSQMKNILQKSLDKIVESQLVEGCTQSIQNLDDSMIELIPDETLDRNTMQNEFVTPPNLICKEHKKEIIFFNLEEQINHRIVCSSCINKKRGEYLVLSEVKRLWKEYQLYEKSLPLRWQQDQNQKVDIVQKVFRISKNNIENIVREAVAAIECKQKSQDELIRKTNDESERKWQQLTYEQALLVAEKLVKYNQLLQSKESDYREDELDVIIQNCIEKVKATQKECFEKLRTIIYGQKQLLDITILQGKKEKGILQLNQQIVNTCVERNQSNLKVNLEIAHIAYENNKNSLKIRNKIISLTLKLVKKLKSNRSIIQQSFCILPQIQKIGNIQNYQLIKGEIIIQHEWCRAMAFNKQSTLLVAACDKMIKIFSFKTGILQQIQLLTVHTGNVLALLFFKNSNVFISTSEDTTIQIWGASNIQLWSSIQCLQNNNSGIECGSVTDIISNRTEDQLITCTSYGYINIFTKKESWVLKQALGQQGVFVRSLSFNSSQSQFAIFSFSTNFKDKFIDIFRQNSDKSWSKYCSIPVDKEGYRLCFIGENLITFQPFNALVMEIFQMSDSQNKFVKSKEARVENYQYCHHLFPQFFNTQKQILINKNGENVHIMKKMDNNFIIEQVIKFGTECVFGTITDNGEYLVTWDNKSLQYQIRKQHV